MQAVAQRAVLASSSLDFNVFFSKLQHRTFVMFYLHRCQRLWFYVMEISWYVTL